AYGGFILLCGFTAFRSGSAPPLELEAETEDAERPGLKLYALWLLLPACASALLLAVTSQLSQNVAAIPLLWVLPLSVYLFSFILCFERAGWYRRNPYIELLGVALASMAYAMFSKNAGVLPIQVGIPLFLIGLFTCCMACHGELARLKPHPRYLTHFYLMISAGGAAGGLLVGLAAPLLCSGRSAGASGRDLAALPASYPALPVRRGRVGRRRIRRIPLAWIARDSGARCGRVVSKRLGGARRV
ncbi:MAG: hypothetical protein ABSC23_22005, partial [Bryobacteraceae bacterium]